VEARILGDLRVRHTLDHQAQHLALARGQVVAERARLPGDFDQRPGGLGRERRAAGLGRPDRAGQLVGRDVLQQVADRAGLQRAGDQLVLPEGRQGDDLRLRAALPDRLGRGRAVHLRHHQVHQDDVGTQPRAQLDRLPSVARLADQLELQERQRLARELHDAVTQALFSASLIADVLPRLWERDPAQGRERLDELRQLTRGALAEMRALLLELRPGALTEVGLGELLQHLSEACASRTGRPVALTLEGEGVLPPDVQVALYRIAQEALGNAAKHAGAGRLTLELRVGKTEVALRIADDGRGFDPTVARPGHFGLGIMGERAAAIGARLALDSRPGRGTQVSLVWPRR
jgi:signal transduction histidine kinase